MIKENYLGEMITFDVVTPKKGTYPIGKFEGIICRLNIPKELGHIEIGCTCIGVVTEQRESSLIVDVHDIVRSAAVNAFNVSRQLEAFKKDSTRKAKAKRSYPFLSKQELNNQSKL